MEGFRACTLAPMFDGNQSPDGDGSWKESLKTLRLVLEVVHLIMQVLPVV